MPVTDRPNVLPISPRTPLAIYRAQASLTPDGALRLTGTVAEGSFAQWAGISWMPGERMMAPANLSSATGIAFRIRGSASGPGVMGFSEAGGQQPETEAGDGQKEDPDDIGNGRQKKGAHLAPP